MCFSAPASFLAAAVACSAGAASLARVKRRADWPLAAMPLFFAAQQAIEGLLWINLAEAPASQATAELTKSFLLFALVFWPIYAPLAAWSAETDARRRQWIFLCVAAGIATSLYFYLSLSNEPRTAAIDGSHISYSADPNLPLAIQILYPAATCLALMLSSHRTIALAGTIILVGSVVSYWMYWNAFTSVWCFFSAIASALIIFHFETARRAALANAEPS